MAQMDWAMDPIDPAQPMPSGSIVVESPSDPVMTTMTMATDAVLDSLSPRALNHDDNVKERGDPVHLHLRRFIAAHRHIHSTFLGEQTASEGSRRSRRSMSARHDSSLHPIARPSRPRIVQPIDVLPRHSQWRWIHGINQKAAYLATLSERAPSFRPAMAAVANEQSRDTMAIEQQQQQHTMVSHLTTFVSSRRHEKQLKLRRLRATYRRLNRAWRLHCDRLENADPSREAMDMGRDSSLYGMRSTNPTRTGVNASSSQDNSDMVLVDSDTQGRQELEEERQTDQLEPGSAQPETGKPVKVEDETMEIETTATIIVEQSSTTAKTEPDAVAQVDGGWAEERENLRERAPASTSTAAMMTSTNNAEPTGRSVVAVSYPPMAPTSMTRSSNRRATQVSGGLVGFGDAVRSEAEFLEILASLESADMQDPNMRAARTTAVEPDMVLDQPRNQASINTIHGTATAAVDAKDEVQVRLFDDDNGFVADPLAFYLSDFDPDVWSTEEESIFTKRYLLFPKQFGKIAVALPHKTAAQCVAHYYLTKKEQGYDYKAMLTSRSRDRRRKPKMVKPKKGRGSALMADLKTIGLSGKEGVELVRGEPIDQEEDEATVNLGTRTASRTAAKRTAEVDPMTGSTGATGTTRKRRTKTDENGEGRTAVRSSTAGTLENGMGKPARPRTSAANADEDATLAGAESDVNRATTAVTPSTTTGKKKRQAKTGIVSDINGSTIVSAEVGVGEATMAAGLDGLKVDPSPAQQRARQATSSYWSVAERNQFLRSVAIFGREWDTVAQHLSTKSAAQARNYFLRNEREPEFAEAMTMATDNAQQPLAIREAAADAIWKERATASAVVAPVVPATIDGEAMGHGQRGHAVGPYPTAERGAGQAIEAIDAPQLGRSPPLEAAPPSRGGFNIHSLLNSDDDRGARTSQRRTSASEWFSNEIPHRSGPRGTEISREEWRAPASMAARTEPVPYRTDQEPYIPYRERMREERYEAETGYYHARPSQPLPYGADPYRGTSTSTSDSTMRAPTMPPAMASYRQGEANRRSVMDSVGREYGAPRPYLSSPVARESGLGGASSLRTATRYSDESFDQARTRSIHQPMARSHGYATPTPPPPSEPAMGGSSNAMARSMAKPYGAAMHDDGGRYGARDRYAVDRYAGPSTMAMHGAPPAHHADSSTHDYPGTTRLTSYDPYRYHRNAGTGGNGDLIPGSASYQHGGDPRFMANGGGGSSGGGSAWQERYAHPSSGAPPPPPPPSAPTGRRTPPPRLPTHDGSLFGRSQGYR